MKNDNEKDLNLNKEKQFSNSNNQLTVVTTTGYKLAKVRLDKNFFENLLVLEMDLEDNFSLEKLFELIKQYSIAIEFYLQHDHIKAKAYQNRMEYLLTNKDTLVQLKRQNDKKNNINNDNINNNNENNNKNNNEKNINNNKIKSALNIQKEYVKIRQDDINLEDISKKVTKVLNSSNKKSENKISWKNIINNDLEKQNSNWKEKLKSKKKNASRFSVKPSLGGIRKRFMGSANDANVNSASNDNNNNVDNNPKVSDFKNPYEELYGEENDKKNNNMDIIEEDAEDKKEEIKENKENIINDPIKNIIIEEKNKEEEKDIDENKNEISQENSNKIENKEEEKDNKEENQNSENIKIEEKKDNIINEKNSEENSKDQKQNEEKEIKEEDKNEIKVDDKNEIKEEKIEIKDEDKNEIKDNKNEIKEEQNKIKEDQNEIKDDKNEIKEDKNEIKEDKNEIKEEKNEIKEDKNEIKEDKNEIKEDKNEIKEEKNEIKEDKNGKDEVQNQNNTEITEKSKTESPFDEPLFSKRKKSILEEDIIGNIKPDDEISSSIESLLTSLKNKIIQINAQNTQNEGNNEEEEESEFSSSNTDLIKVKSSNNDLDKIPGKFQGAYLDIQTIMDNYIYDFNQFFYKEIFEQFSSDLKELYEQKYKKYIEIRNEYHAQIKENEYLLELDENLTKEKKEEIQQTIESLNEEQQHQIDVVEDEFNKKISDKISEFKQNTFKHNSGIQLLEEKVKLDIYSLINDAFIN